MIELADMLKNVVLHSVATALANSVLPEIIQINSENFSKATDCRAVSFCGQLINSIIHQSESSVHLITHLMHNIHHIHTVEADALNAVHHNNIVLYWQHMGH